MPHQETYKAPDGGWVCFHCGERFMSPGAAADHFGETQDYQPACVMMVELGRERGLIMELRKAQREVRWQEERIEQLEYQAAVDADNWTRIVGLKRAHNVAFELDCMEGRALAAEAVLAEIESRWPALVQASRRRVEFQARKA
ncbi:hypothetical protein KAJ83_09610 [Marivibrio halodurans]|uniref:Uncharacterized protein n=1 Tax=Marivibrio halodurans TaxID=2039722 RepID=A0A8J7S244_9PROT|nr:hypothetical protein [Marivibrio halodurans]MBP5857264.1 hypothetical protein [Marivibrio halodurans]